jgi:acyl carrier protein
LTDPATIERFLVDDLEIESDGGRIAAEEDLLASGLLDSMAITQVVVFLEEQFGVAIGDEDLVAENFASIKSMAALVDKKAR